MFHAKNQFPLSGNDVFWCRSKLSEAILFIVTELDIMDCLLFFLFVEFVKVKPINSSCIVVSWSHPRKPQGQMKSYCLEAIPLLDTAQDGFINRFAFPSISSSPSSSYNSNDNNNDRAKGPCIRPDFTSSYNYYFYCGK